MKIIYNKVLPFPGYSAMMLFGVIFAREDSYPLSEYTINHEAIHEAQAKDCRGYILYYLLYLWQWIRFGYENMPLEREAHSNAVNLDYLDTRKPKAWRKYK